METILVFGGIAIAIVGYLLSKVYLDKVGEKYGYNINGSKARFLPMIGWIVVIMMETNDNSNIPLEIVAVLVTTLLYAGILYKKTNNIKDSILVALINGVVSFAVAIFVILKVILNLLSGKVTQYDKENKILK